MCIHKIEQRNVYFFHVFSSGWTSFFSRTQLSDVFCGVIPDCLLGGSRGGPHGRRLGRRRQKSRGHRLAISRSLTPPPCGRGGGILSARPQGGEPWCIREGLPGFVLYSFFYCLLELFYHKCAFFIHQKLFWTIFLQKFFHSGKAWQALGSVCKVQGNRQPPPKKWARSPCALADRLLLSPVEPQGTWVHTKESGKPIAAKAFPFTAI